MTIRSASRLAHLAPALVGGVSVVVAGLTGSVLVYRGEIDRLINPGLHHVPPTGTARALEEVRAAVERDGGPPLRLILPAVAPGRSTIAVRLRLPEESSPHGNTAIRFDRHTGATLQVHSSRMTNPTQKLLWYAAYPWHTGDALGPVGRAITALSGLAPTVLLVTGLIWWRRKAGGRERVAARNPG